MNGTSGLADASGPVDASALHLASITMDRNFALLLGALSAAALWLVYNTYYNSRVLGFLLTRLINKFYFQDDNFKIGSFTLNALSGKIMFRDIVYINYDYTLRIQDGYLIFRWWRSYIPKDVSEDLSHSDTRLSIVLNGFELHFYNRCEMYSELEKVFGLEPSVKQQFEEFRDRDRDQAMNDANEKRRRAQEAVRSEAAMARTWRDLIPVIKADVCSARVVFGNRLVPTTLSVSAEDARLLYSTKPPASSLDHVMHFVKAKVDNCKVILAPSPNYTSMVDEPPRFMGEGFVVMSSNYIEVYFYMDEPGVVPERPVLLQLANGDVVESAPPIWGVDIKCGKGTDFSYGPWADRQRDHLFKFFFPPNYKNLEVTPQPKPGDRRQTQSFDIRLSTLNEATIDILFTKNKETNAVHINVGAGSYLEVTLPWIVLQDGYTTKITGQLLHLEATTSLQYRSLAESETLEYTVKCHYPLVWNHHQCWQLSLTGCKATAHLVYTHVDFFQDLVNDWASKARPDILHFVPYTWKISFLLKECEVVTVSNQYNWIDCSSTNQENNHVAFCGDLLDVSFDLPFIDYLPDIIPLKIWIQGEAVDMSLYLPEVNTSRLLLLSIDKNMKLVPCRLKASKWRRKCVKSQGWVDCWSVPIVALSVRYNYHPIPPLGPEPQADITTPEKEEILLSPMRIPRMRKQPQMNWTTDGTRFDRTTLAPDKVSVELEVGPSILLAYGTIITSFMNLIENIFGEDQTFTDMQKSPNLDAYYWAGEAGAVRAERAADDAADAREPLEPRRYRPLDVRVSIIIHDIQAHLLKNCSDSEPPCPIVLIERFGFEMDKSFRETKLQLLLSPSILVSSNNLSRTNAMSSGALYQGHLMLSSFQLRGHGFFSDTNRSADQDTVEYAWMMELQLGQLTGRLTLPQLYQVVSSLETFLLLVSDSENELCPPNPAKQCHHGLNDVQCPETDLSLKYRCPTSNEIKYRMVRVAIDLIDIYVADNNTTLQTCISPIRLSFCNLHGPGVATGLTGLLSSIKLALYTQTNMATHYHSNSSNSSQNRPPEGDNWVGVGSVSLGPLTLEAATALPDSPRNLHHVQQKFLKLHDEKTKRLWFMWPGEGRSLHCGCLGGCAFFGSNRNGPNFFKPSPSDAADGVNVAAFHVIEGATGEFGYGQSLLHAGQLVFHTPPYGRHVRLAAPREPRPRTHAARRASYASAGKPAHPAHPARCDVPYARLVDAPLQAAKIDSDSKLNKTVLAVPQLESSVSDSRLALGYSARDSTRRLKTEGEAFTIPRAGVRSVGASESHYSLDSQPQPDDVASEVRRTVSIASENQSEAFFSADEDIFPSRSSSLKHSFGSRHSAVRDKSSLPGDTTTEKWCNSAPRPEPADGADAGPQPDSESGSVSSTSFISAISSQEDMTLVNLHMQTNKPIVDSPLLMSSYMHNLPQYRCGNWGSCSLPSGSDAFTMPLFRRADDGTLVYVGQRYLPNFEPVGKVNVLKLSQKKENHAAAAGPAPHSNAQFRSHPYPCGWWDAQGGGGAEASEPACSGSDSRGGLAVKLRGEVDVLLTPLVLESVQRFVESLTPVLAAVHPVTVVTHLRLLSVSAVQRANVLKQRRYELNWLPQLQARERGGERDDRCKLATISREHACVYEETVSEHVQVTVAVPRLNVVLVQSSVVEDMISFSALDNIQDLTCVSLFGVMIENVTAKYASSRRSDESVQLYYRPALRVLASKKSFGIMKGGRVLGGSSRRAPERGEPVYIESSQQNSEDTTFTINIGKIHGQLRRVRNESSQLKDATITGIPCQYSKVAFKFSRIEHCSDGCDGTCCRNGTVESQKESAIGYIMFECGLEGVSVKVSRLSEQGGGEEAAATPRDADSLRGSVHSADERPERAASRATRASQLDELLRKRDSGSKPGTPNPGAAPAAEPEPEPDAAAAVAPPAPHGSATSCAVDLKTVWFNFAAPPRTPITQKIDYTRLDWNLLSTASPAINAWMNPCNRLGIRVVALYRAHARRLAATAACLMAGALDLAPHHAPPKSRYGRHTAMARQLREEPSLQLCGALLRHALQADAAAVQADLAERHLPSLSTLRQGVVVLSRQWKNILYSPLLLEHGYRNKVLKPLNVTFALPDLLEEEPQWATATGGADTDAADESCLLLHAAPHQEAAGEEGVGAETESIGSGGGSRREDLYQWMASQQPDRTVQEVRSRRPLIPAARLPTPAPAPAPPASGPIPAQGSLMLLDAHLVFQPLLAALGVEPQQVAGEALESLGARLSLQAWVEAVRADIVVGALGRNERRRAAPAPDAAAFLCEKLSADVDARRLHAPAARRAVYVSRAHLRRGLSTVVNFNVGVRFISQQVNMPLLRLLHQIATMYQNVKDAQVELRGQADRGRRADGPPSSSVSDFRENLVSVSSLDRETQYSTLDSKWELLVADEASPRIIAPPAPVKAPPPRPRPQSFAQKLRSTSKSVKGKLGYSSLSEGAHTPMFPALPPPAAAPPPAEPLAPRCWRTLYLLLDLYARMPDADANTHRLSASSELPRREAGGLVVAGGVRIQRTRLLASLSGLKLEAELTALQAALSAARARHSLTGTLGRSTIVLLEGAAPHHTTVVRVSVGKSQALHSREEGGGGGGSLLLSVGGVRVELPQHPVALHGVMTRSSRQLSSTLQELGVGRGAGRRAEESPPPPPPPPPPAPRPDRPAPAAPPPPPPPPPLQFSVAVQSLSVTAALLPSLQAQYKMEEVSGSGVTGEKAHFTLELPQHSLSFATKLAATEANIPAAAMVALPAVHVSGRVLETGAGPEGAVLRAGRYLHATADIGLFEHTLSTDLLNHLVFVQKVFMKEVNEVVQKVSGGEKPVPLWADDAAATSPFARALFSLLIRIQRIQLTATTPSNSAVRLETGAVELELSNRVQNVPRSAHASDVRLFVRAQVDLNVSLGQLIRNVMFEEAEPEFQQYAFFNTRISMRNLFQDEMEGPAGAVPEPGAEASDVVLIRLKRPLVYVQPVAVDRAILVWLNYKNAYEYWNEKRRSLNTEVLHATQQLIEKVQLTSQMAAPHLSSLFLQLDVDDIGVCLPLTPPPMLGCPEAAGGGAVVVTLESTSVRACSMGALVSQGRFVGLCLRFADDFEASLDDWQPRADEPALNVCCVSEGTYEVCSRTTAAKHNENAKWFLNVSWQMEGVDIHLDVSVGQQLSALGHTLTMLTGFEEEDPLGMDFDSDLDDEADTSKGSQESVVLRRKADHLPAFVFDARLDARQRSKLIEHEMNEQAKIINDLRALGASHATVELEMRRLHDLEALVFKDFRRDMIQKLRRQSVKATSYTRGKLGLGSNRSRSFVAGPGTEPKDAPDQRLPDIGEQSTSAKPFTTEEDERGPTRAASLRGCGAEWRRPGGVQRQSSLPARADLWPPGDLDDDPEVELRHKPDQGAGGEGGAGGGKPKAAEPNIDFELDVKVHVNSGKCVLHTKEPTKEDDPRLGGRMRVGRSTSGGLSEGGGSPSARRRVPVGAPRHHPALDVTVFRVPGLDCKVHYESKTVGEDESPAAPLRRGKKAALFAWITVQSIPEETIVSPHILEFMEYALEPIPIKSFAPPAIPTTADGDGSAAGEAAEGGEAAGSYGQYVYASFPVDVIVHFHMQPSTFRFSCLPASRVECLLQLPTLQIVCSSKRATDDEESQPEEGGGGAARGGLSVTSCLADFSLYVFHPYGGKKSSLKEAQWSPLQDSERKDSLSINVEFVKFHLSRSRKLDIHSDLDHSKATVRFSTILDVGSAWFKYDMRRLGEILAFPKAWYRRTIVRRMFLGDLSAPDRSSSAHTHQSTSNTVPVSPMLPQKEKIKSEAQKPKDKAAWETLVLFAVNFTKLNVHMNMGNVMGNVSWQSRDFNCSGRLSIGSTGHRNMLLGVALASSALDARGGIVGGAISLSAIHTYVHISEEPGGMPAHVCGVRLAALELRLEYMGTPVLLARVSRLRAAGRDEWLGQHPRPAVILAHGTLAWQQLQVLMSRSTTPDLLKMQLKLEEFFTQQFKSSKRVFSSLHPDYRGRRAWERQEQAARAASEAEARAQRPARLHRHHRHWQRALRQLAGLHLATLSAPLPAHGMVLGGTMELHGANVSLACFHGNSFKSKSWALFSLKDPFISFATEAQQLADEAGDMEVHVVQSLTAGLGLGAAAAAGAAGGGHQSMGTVCRMTRAMIFPPQFKTLREWFQYAFANSEIDAIELFPSLEREAGAAGGASDERRAAGGKAGAHAREVIFALPSLQLHLRTQHRQAHEPPKDDDPMPVVECSFITEFEDHIFVSVDAEAFLFLHDLISSYIKEKSRVMGSATRGSGAAAAADAAAVDFRDYHCLAWHLEPTVRLLSWAGKSIEPYGVDYILQKLGFRHARTTIPKWVQRGALDPLDHLTALLMRRLAAILPKRH